MNNPMDQIHALKKRVAQTSGHLADVVNFIVIPRQGAPDLIAVTFKVKSDALKSGEEIASEALHDDFMDVLGDMTLDVDDEGNTVIVGGEEAADEMDAEERERIEQMNNDLVAEMLQSLKEDTDEVP